MVEINKSNTLSHCLPRSTLQAPNSQSMATGLLSNIIVYPDIEFQGINQGPVQSVLLTICFSGKLSTQVIERNAVSSCNQSNIRTGSSLSVCMTACSDFNFFWRRICVLYFTSCRSGINGSMLQFWRINASRWRCESVYFKIFSKLTQYSLFAVRVTLIPLCTKMYQMTSKSHSCHFDTSTILTGTHGQRYRRISKVGWLTFVLRHNCGRGGATHSGLPSLRLIHCSRGAHGQSGIPVSLWKVHSSSGG